MVPHDLTRKRIQPRAIIMSFSQDQSASECSQQQPDQEAGLACGLGPIAGWLELTFSLASSQDGIDLINEYDGRLQMPCNSEQSSHHLLPLQQADAPASLPV